MSVLKDSMSEWLIPLLQKDSDDLFCLGARRYFTALSTRCRIYRKDGLIVQLESTCHFLFRPYEAVSYFFFVTFSCGVT